MRVKLACRSPLAFLTCSHGGIDGKARAQRPRVDVYNSLNLVDCTRGSRVTNGTRCRVPHKNHFRACGVDCCVNCLDVIGQPHGTCTRGISFETGKSERSVLDAHRIQVWCDVAPRFRTEPKSGDENQRHGKTLVLAK